MANTQQGEAQGKAPAAHKTLVHVAKAMAALGARAVVDAGLRDAARADLARQTAGASYVSPLPAEAKPALNMSVA